MHDIIPLTKDKTTKRRKRQQYDECFYRRRQHIAIIVTFCIVLLGLYVSAPIWIGRKEWYHRDNYVQKNCRHLRPIQQPDLSKLSPKRRERYAKTQDAIRHSWRGYINAVSLYSKPTGGIPHDDLAPVSGTAFSWLNYGATLYDSIDTLFLANLTQEYEHAVQWLTTYDIQTTSIQATKTFEYSLRIIGGLLGAYSLTGDPRLFATAQNAADAILDGPFKASPTIIPRPFNVLAPSTSATSLSWDLKATIQRTYQALYNFGRNRLTEEHRSNSLAGFGSFGLEFSYLSSVSGDLKYRKVSDNIFRHVTAFERDGIVPNLWNVLTGEPLTSGGSLGSGSDSFYEYLLKIPLLNSCYYDEGLEMFVDSCTHSDKKHLELYEKMVKSALLPYHTKRGSIDDVGDSQFLFPVERRNRYDHLLCFLPGLLALGASTRGGASKQTDMSLAEDLVKGCAALYEKSPTGLSPDTGFFNLNSFAVSDPAYYLRPEFVESLFIIYRTTNDDRMQDMGWQVLESIEKYCKIEDGGYAGLKDVNQIPPPLLDDMPSYFLAETLKYLLLLFGPDDYISMDDFVFTTEAHPLRILSKADEDEERDLLPICTLQTRPPVPVPSTLLLLALLIMVVVLGGLYILWTSLQIMCVSVRRRIDKRKKV